MGLGSGELLFILAAIALLFGPGAVLVWWLMTQSRASGESPELAKQHESPDPAVEAARERYARGEISREEFEEIKTTLGI